jgi:hypothetical protein
VQSPELDKKKRKREITKLGLGSVVKPFPSICKALSLIPSSTKKKQSESACMYAQERREREREREERRKGREKINNKINI